MLAAVASSGCRAEPTISFLIDFHAHAAVGTIDQPAVWRPAMLRVERNRGQPRSIVGFPLVHPAVAVAVLLGGGQRVLPIVFDAGHLAVAARRDLDAVDRAVRLHVGPGVFPAIVQPGFADLLQLLIGSVVLPAVDLAVFVLVDLDAD